MKHLRAFGLVAALVSAMLVSGCAGTALGGTGQFFANATSSIAGPSSATAVKAVASIELGYTAAANLAVVALDSGQLSAAQASTLKELNDAIDVKGADGKQHGLLVAARTAAENGDSIVITASYQALVQGMDAFTGFEKSNKIGVSP